MNWLERCCQNARVGGGKLRLAAAGLLAAIPSMVVAAGAGRVDLDARQQSVILADGQGDLTLRLRYDGRCVLDQVIVRGRSVAAPAGVASGVSVAGQWFTTRAGIATPHLEADKETLVVTGITYGPPGIEIHETWKFTVDENRILWRVTRKFSRAATLDDAAFPEWDFSDMSTWTGGLLDDGGVVWNKYLDTTNATYGAHASGVTFWNRTQNDGLRITPTLAPRQHAAVRFSHQPDNVFSFNYSVSAADLKPKHDFDRFLQDRQDLWAPFSIGPGESTVEYALEALKYDETYDRGTFKGLDGGNIRELLNTVARYGVIDNHIVGGNGWRSGYICLHEQWFGEIGAALDAPDYITNLSRALDFERDHAISPEGRVKSRWTYDDGDAMRGTYDAFGYYEAQWGILLDSQPDYVINVAELYDVTGDRKWLAGQKVACEKALDFLTRREVDHTGLVAMMTDSLSQQRGSDWIDIIWASYENALVNAELFYALGLWANAEDTLGDTTRAATYRDFAARLKTTFNRPIADGGFWDPAHQWYVYWREKDGSIHGNNLVVPVNFTAIGYGLCDDPARQTAILNRIELEMKKENLFTWPANFFPYQPGEGHRRNFPFPNYENGDLFLSWGELGVRAYAAHDPALALKYVRKILDRYQQDGLSYQRYQRAKQDGSGDDILAGNCMTIVGLYRDIYGVQPQPNRLYLDPHLTSELNGTQLHYQLRGRPYVIDLSTTGCSVTSGSISVAAPLPFGINATPNGLEYFPGTNTAAALAVSRDSTMPLALHVSAWPDDPAAPRHWTESSASTGAETAHVLTHLRPHALYVLKASGENPTTLRTDGAGRLDFTCKSQDVATRTFELAPVAN